MHGTVRTPNLAQTFLVITHRRSLQDATRLIRDGFQRRALRAARGAGRSESTAIRDPSFYIRAGLVRLRRRAAQGRPLAHAMCLAQCPSGARSAPGARSGERRAPCDSRHEWLIRRDTEQRGRLVEGCSSNVEQAIGRRREEWAWGEGKALQLFVGCSGPGIDAPIVLPQAVSLSLVAADWFFVEFVDGATQFVLPPQWHGAVNKYTAQNVRKQVPTMVTSFASTPSPSHSTPSPHTSRLGSHSSFSPLNSPNPASVFHTPNPRPVFHTPNPAPVYNTPNPAPFYNTPNPAPVYNTPNPGPVYGHAPYTPNPYVQPYASVPQFVPQPPPPPPPQQHQQAVHVTNVYNTIQQPEKPSHNSSGTVQLLGGALKVAGALLPLFTGGNNSNGGGFF